MEFLGNDGGMKGRSGASLTSALISWAPMRNRMISDFFWRGWWHKTFTQIVDTMAHLNLEPSRQARFAYLPCFK
jgi:hypothetical protein